MRRESGGADLAVLAGKWEGNTPPSSPSHRHAGAVPSHVRRLRLLLCLVVVSNLGVAAPGIPGALRCCAALYLLFALPTWLVSGKVRWKTSTPTAWILSLACVVLGIIVAALAVNQVLPLVGVDRPLTTGPLLVSTDLAVAALLTWRRRVLPLRPTGHRPTRETVILAALAAATLVLSIAGPIRLNNGLSGNATLVMLVLAGITLVALIRLRDRVPASVVIGVLYFVSLSLLLMTSLRGWYVTGHDVQREFRVFELTATNGSWQMERFQDAYNACMSITLLPTVIGHLTGLPDMWVFKTVFQALFALCPVQVYLLGRRFGGSLVGILSCTYFIAFPTYFTDMPFLNRQAVAFFFIGCIFLVVTEDTWSIARRRRWVALLSVGTVLSHYATTYMLIGVLVVAWLLQRVGPVAVPLLRKLRLTRAAPGRSATVMGLTNIAVLLGLAMIWTGPLTHTGGQLEHTLATTISGITGQSGARSSDVNYGLLSGHAATPQEEIDRYRQQTLEETAVYRGRGDYLPDSAVANAPTVATSAAPLPLTPVGKAAEAVGINVGETNAVIREVSAEMLQVVACLGFLATFVGLRHGLRTSREFFAIASGSFAAVAAAVILPAVSVEYGLLRTFQQSLFVMGPFLVAGSLQLLPWLRGRWAALYASGLALLFFSSLTGVLPQVLGAYPPQLHLNNAGQYYDIYYTHAEERAAVEWLRLRLPANGWPDVQSEMLVDRYSFPRPGQTSGHATTTDMFPTLVLPDSYVFLGYTTVHSGRATISVNGDLPTYRYPVELLLGTKDLLYTNGGSSIFR
jgi:uncharacterized membrane protein